MRGATSLSDEWGLQGRKKLVGDGYAGACAALAALMVVAGVSLAVCGEVAEKLNYFAGQHARLGYAVWLHRGRSLGSGLVEGSIERLVRSAVAGCERRAVC